MPGQTEQNGRTVGVEIEHQSRISFSGMAASLQNVGLQVDHSATGQYYSRGQYHGWQAKSDGSIGRTGIELVSPPLTLDDMETQLRTALNVAKQHGSVDRRCGLHVHVYAGDLTPAQIEKLKSFWLAIEGVVFSFVAPSRRNNSYCGRGVNGRGAINFGPLSMYGTVEFRVHQSTLNFTKVMNWIRFCYRIVEFAKNNNEIPQTINPEIVAGQDMGTEQTITNFKVKKVRRTCRHNADGTFEIDGQIFQTLIDACMYVIKIKNPNRTKAIKWVGMQWFIEGSDGTTTTTAAQNPMQNICDMMGVNRQTANYLTSRYTQNVTRWGIATTRSYR